MKHLQNIKQTHRLWLFFTNILRMIQGHWIVESNTDLETSASHHINDTNSDCIIGAEITGVINRSGSFSLI